MSYEYKCVGAPERPKRQRGVRGRSDRVALAMQDLIAAEAVDGWEYQRTDLVPVEERSGLFGRVQEVHRAVLVFRRELEPEPRIVAPGRLRAAKAREAAGTGGQAAPSARPERQTEEQAGERAGRRIPLAAERDGPAPGAKRDGPPPGPKRDGSAPGAKRDGPPPGAKRDEPAPPAPARGNRPPPSGLG